MRARKYVVQRFFQGIPKREDFKILEYELRSLQENEILLKTEYVSVDPYQRAYNRMLKPPYDQSGYQIAQVIESKCLSYPIGTKVVSQKGWCDFSIVNIKKMLPHETVYKVPEVPGFPETIALNTLGLTGVTAYFGLLELCQPKPGETVVVTGAAGAVGTAVGQIAKIKGCKVIGFTGTDEKVKILETEFGFDKAYNYKTVDADKELGGVDCFFDNTGGELSSIIIKHMNEFGRVAVCGSISSYNDADLPKATILQPALVFKQIKMEGFVVTRWMNRWPEALAQLGQWMSEGKIVERYHQTDGFENIYNAFVGMLAGENVGKAIVKI